MATAFVDVEGGQLFCTIDGAGPAVVLLHGGLLNLHLFDPQVEALSERYTLVRVDLRGYGRSSMPTEGRYRHCDDVAAVADSLGFDEIVVGGESFGGAVALDFAFAHPDRTRGLILEAAGPITGWEWHEGFPLKGVFTAFAAEGADAARQAMLDSPVMVAAMDRPAVAAALTEIVDGYSFWHFQHRDPAEWAEPNAVSRLEEIAAPALVIGGGLDALDLRLMAETLGDRLPNAEYHVIPNSGHTPNLEEPEVFSHLVLEFLGRLPAAQELR